jgi:uncharacterized protein YcfJ
VGAVVGDKVGDVEGDWVGDVVGDAVGDVVGAVVGDVVGDYVGEMCVYRATARSACSCLHAGGHAIPVPTVSILPQWQCQSVRTFVSVHPANREFKGG